MLCWANLSGFGSKLKALQHEEKRTKIFLSAFAILSQTLVVLINMGCIVPIDQIHIDSTNNGCVGVGSLLQADWLKGSDFSLPRLFFENQFGT